MHRVCMVVEILKLGNEWVEKKCASRHELQDLQGKLQFICKCVHQITDEASADVAWFTRFSPEYNGVSPMLAKCWSQLDEIFATDACLVRCGAVCGAHDESTCDIWGI